MRPSRAARLALVLALAPPAALAAQQQPSPPPQAAASQQSSASSRPATSTPAALAPAAFVVRAPDRVVLDVPYFGQTLDAPWGGDFMGDSRALIADNGCIMTCAAMSLAGFGADTDPGRLNRALIGQGLYADMSFRGEQLGRMAFSYESIRVLYPALKSLKMRGKVTTQADAQTLRNEIRAGRPIIATVVFRRSYNHAILIYGFEGADFLVHDPMDPGNRTLAQYAQRAGNATAGPFDCVIGTAVYSPEAR
jgi:hypothetical protein